MIPLHDDNPTTIRPVVTIALIVANALVFLGQLGLGNEGGARAVYGLGMIPAVLFGSRDLSPDLEVVLPEFTLITSLFLHGGWMHLIGNMMYLWIFGNNIEDAMGHVRFVVFYLICGIAASLAQAATDPASTIPTIGASGAVSGVLGAYLVLHPRARVLVLLPLGFFWHTFRIQAMYVLGFWFVFQFLNVALAGGDGGGGGVAWWAHIGGFIVGMGLIFVFRSGGPRVFRRRRGPWG
jgi:membrane associated rhomboid family serine protease